MLLIHVLHSTKCTALTGRYGLSFRMLYLRDNEFNADMTRLEVSSGQSSFLLRRPEGQYGGNSLHAFRCLKRMTERTTRASFRLTIAHPPGMGQLAIQSEYAGSGL